MAVFAGGYEEHRMGNQLEGLDEVEEGLGKTNCLWPLLPRSGRLVPTQPSARFLPDAP